MTIRVVVIDDSAVIRSMLTVMLNKADDIEVVGTAVDPFDAREKIKALNPDVITLDIEMPKMDGITFLTKIMSLRPMPVVMVSTLTQKGAEVTLKALELGAVDYVSKPTAHRPGEGMDSLQQELIDKVRVAASANISRMPVKASASPQAATQYQSHLSDASRIIAIGSSTGGVEALRDLLIPLPANLPPIVITQHMPPRFTSALAERMDKQTKFTFTEAKHGIQLKPGNAYIAPGDKHMVVAQQGNMFICRLHDDEPVSGHKPSVDVLFESVAKAYGAHAIGVILTGMGRDGAKGLKLMRDEGATTIGQNKETCVVYGMPRAAMEEKAVQSELPLSQIGAAILKHLSGATSDVT